MHKNKPFILCIFYNTFLAALVDSIGGGGGLISLPAYTLAGLPYGLASGCNKFSACFASMAATFRFFKSKKILWLPALFAIAGTLPCAWFGTWLSNRMGNEFMHLFMIVAIPVVGVLVAWFSGNLFLVALSACGVVFLVELLIL